MTLPEHMLAVAHQDLVGAESEIMERVATTPAEAVPAALHALTELDGVIGRIRATLEARASADGLREWTAPDGTEYEFDGTHRRVVRDVAGLRDALLSLPCNEQRTQKGMRDLERATFRAKMEVLMSALNEAAERDEEIRDIRDDFCVWQNGPPHLRPKEMKQ